MKAKIEVKNSLLYGSYYYYWVYITCFSIFLFILGACATSKPIDGAKKDLFEFLHPGQTTRDEVITTIGYPSNMLELWKIEIFNYRVGYDEKRGYFIIQNTKQVWSGARYSLILIFDSNNVLSKFSLIIEGAKKDLFEFLHPSQTTFDEVLTTLGYPSNILENWKIFNYRVGYDEKRGYFIIHQYTEKTWLRVRYSLVLIFDSNNILSKFSLVNVK